MKLTHYFVGFLAFATKAAYVPSRGRVDLSRRQYLRDSAREQRYSRLEELPRLLDERRRARYASSYSQIESSPNDDIQNFGTKLNKSAPDEPEITYDKGDGLIARLRDRRAQRKKAAETDSSTGEPNEEDAPDGKSAPLASETKLSRDSSDSNEEDSDDNAGDSQEEEESKGSGASDKGEDLLTRLRSRRAQRKKAAETDSSGGEANDEAGPDEESAPLGSETKLDSDSNDESTEDSQEEEESKDSDASDKGESRFTRFRNRHTRRKRAAPDAVVTDSSTGEPNEEDAPDDETASLDSGTKLNRDSSDSNDNSNDESTEDSGSSDKGEDLLSRLRNRRAQRKKADETDSSTGEPNEDVSEPNGEYNNVASEEAEIKDTSTDDPQEGGTSGESKNNDASDKVHDRSTQLRNRLAERRKALDSGYDSTQNIDHSYSYSRPQGRSMPDYSAPEPSGRIDLLAILRDRRARRERGSFLPGVQSDDERSQGFDAGRGRSRYRL